MRILVTGATGTIGRPLIEALSTTGIAIRALARTPQPATFPAHVEAVAGDLSRPDTVIPYVDDVDALFLHPRAARDSAIDLLRHARERGVRLVVVLSAINVDEPLDHQPSRFRGDRNKEVEEAAVASGMQWVSLRANTFAMNTLGAWGEQIRAGDVVRYPYAAFAEAVIHERDIAEVGAHALLHPELAGRRLDLTGPQPLSHAEMVAIIGEVLARPLAYHETPPELARRGMIMRGFPEPFVAALFARCERGLGRPAACTDTVERVLGRPARPYAQWVDDHRADFTPRQHA